VLILKRFFDQIPVELEDAARVDGANRLRVFWSIVLPLSRPILAAVAIFAFVGAWNNVLWPFIVTTGAQFADAADGPADSQKRVRRAVCAEHGIRDPRRAAAGGRFLFFQRQIIKGIATTGFGGQ
jgi:multiple sugar transport system permease protein